MHYLFEPGFFSSGPVQNVTFKNNTITGQTVNTSIADISGSVTNMQITNNVQTCGNPPGYSETNKLHLQLAP